MKARKGGCLLWLVEIAIMIGILMFVTFYFFGDLINPYYNQLIDYISENLKR